MSPLEIPPGWDLGPGHWEKWEQWEAAQLWKWLFFQYKPSPSPKSQASQTGQVTQSCGKAEGHEGISVQQ